MNIRLACSLAALATLTACAGFYPARVQPGQSAEEVARNLGLPTGRYRLAGGSERLEYARGPYGKQTWMIDLDAQGRVSAVTQVLTEARFNQLAAGTPREQVLATLGRPSNRRPGGWQGGEIWAWRYDAVFCTWFQATMGEDGRVRDTGYGTDPACEDMTAP